MRTQKSSSTKSRIITAGKVLTKAHRNSIRLALKSTTPASSTVKRLQTILSSFRARVKKLAKASNGKTRH